jgi:hypothetical protein
MISSHRLVHLLTWYRTTITRLLIQVFEKKIAYLPTSKIVIHRAFNIFQVYQYFIIYRWYRLLKFEHFSLTSYTTLFEIRRYQRPF